ncbi:hypothetical protein AB0D57_39975 [Streptomyces sp. NPDC048275]|uniref:hypothetical protein n=1 Tax=Streptomyces sp. NPDC048275 TaxID=3155629 RepID=UPI0033DCAADC
MTNVLNPVGKQAHDVHTTGSNRHHEQHKMRSVKFLMIEVAFTCFICLMVSIALLSGSASLLLALMPVWSGSVLNSGVWMLPRACSVVCFVGGP